MEIVGSFDELITHKLRLIISSRQYFTTEWPILFAFQHIPSFLQFLIISHFSNDNSLQNMNICGLQSTKHPVAVKTKKKYASNQIHLLFIRRETRAVNVKNAAEKKLMEYF